MNHFVRKRGQLFAEDVPLQAIADELGTPTYVYAQATLERHFRVFSDAFLGRPHRVCYSVKANGNLALLKLFATLGSGFDIVSLGELRRARAAGSPADRLVFAGVGKRREEMEAALAEGILLFNVESAEELVLLDAVGRAMNKKAPFALRVNPEVDARTHRHIATGLKTSKFGIPMEEAKALYQRSKRMKGVRALGVDAHIGSQLTHLGPVRTAVRKVAGFYRALKAQGHALSYLDVGGGLGIPYTDEAPPSPEAYAQVVREETEGVDGTLLLEPGRVMVGNAGVLLTRVLYRKESPSRRFVIVDAGMNDLLRPALYEAHHQIVPVVARKGRPTEVDVVGPICESTDVLGKARSLVLPRQGDLLAILSAGAYGMSMASTYNSRPRPAEVLVSQKGFRVIRAREPLEDLWRGEST